MNRPHQSYQLLIKIKNDISLQIGKLGHFDFPAGFYVYTGSAKRNMDARLRRHYSLNKKPHWHIDYLLIHRDVEIITTRKSSAEECELNMWVNGETVAKGFGSSDCRQKCSSHLKKINNSNFDCLF